MPFLRPTLTAPLLAALFCATPGQTPEPAVEVSTATPQSGRSTLLVFITVDQMRADYLDRWKGQLTGGLKRLAEGGAVFTNGHQDHAITETAPGHASTMSGRHPRSTGITRNLAGVNDPNSPLIGSGALGASPFRFRGTTLVDWLTAANPATRALSVSSKDRGAILPIGRSKQQVYWYNASGSFTTSKWYRDTLPDWVQAFNVRQMPQDFAGKTWDPLLPSSEYAEPDSVVAESRGQAFMFPHRLSAGRDTAAARLPGTPFMDEVTAALALHGIQSLGLGNGPGTDVAAVSFSATDYIGHRFGPDSREVHDQILRLDRILGGFIDSLYKLRDSTRIIFALTGDHGVASFPELNTGRLTPPPSRVDLTPAIDAAVAVMRRAKADTGAVDLESGAFVVERRRGITPALIKESTDSFVAVAGRIPGVLRADRFRDLAAADFGKDPIARRWIQMFPPDVPVEATVTLTPGSYWWYYGVAQHGTPHDYDSQVPIIFYGPGFKPGRYDQFARTVDMAPTLAQVLGVTPTEPLDGKPLTAAIK
jgi:predicted AlkP superfamily pyrophosphatase or phosphodiesterase